MTADNTWEANIHREVAFWRKWLTDPAFAQAREARIANGPSSLKGLIHWAKESGFINTDEKRTVRILDVGSGPISVFGAGTDGVELICVDALAEYYNEMMNDSLYSDLPKTIPLKGEKLRHLFSQDSFDVVYCANALDHFDEPEIAFVEMFDICTSDGAMVIISMENEGERENYSGLHQWNLRASDRGFWLSSKSNNMNLLNKIGNNHTYSWEYIRQHKKGNIFKVIIEKNKK